MTITSSLINDLNWWSKNVLVAKNTIKTFNPIIEIFSGASTSGWGAVYNNSLVDNTTSIAYISKKGEIRILQLKELAEEIWTWYEESRLWIFASYIRSENNSFADFESRSLEPETEYNLSDKAFHAIVHRFCRLVIDLSIVRANAKCKRYVSWEKDCGSIAIDALQPRGILVVSHWTRKLVNA